MIYREITGKDEEEFPLERGMTLEKLQKLVISTYPKLKDIQESMLTAINEKLVDNKQILIKKGDVIAFFPSLSGG